MHWIQLLYYYFYQNSRKNPIKKTPAENHHLAIGFIATFFFTATGAIYATALHTGVKPFGLSGRVVLLLFMLISAVLGYLIDKGPMNRKKMAVIVEKYDKQYTYKKRGKLLNALILFLVYFGVLFTGLLVGLVVKAIGNKVL